MRRSVLACLVAALPAFGASPLPAQAQAPPSQAQQPTQPTTSTSAQANAVIKTGGTWTWENPTPDGETIFALSCPGPTTCFAGGTSGTLIDALGSVLVSGDGGLTWAQEGPPGHIISGISCPSTLFCVAVAADGLVLSTTDGGVNWSSQTINGGKFLGGVYCSSSTLCYAVGAGGAIFRWTGGPGWTPQASGTTYDFYGISCLDACYAVGDVGVVSDKGGWHTVAGGAYFRAISCTAHSCTAVGVGGTQVYDPLHGWQAGHAGNLVDFYGVSCVSATTDRCFATGTDGNVHIATVAIGADLGTPTAVTWGVASVGESGTLWAASCASPSVCFVAGDHGIVASTSGAGTLWSPLTSPTTGRLLAVSCPSATACTAVGDVIASTTGGLNNWSIDRSPLNPNFPVTSVSCPSTTLCVMMDNGGGIYRSGGPGTAVSGVILSGQPFMWSLACVPATTTCYIATSIYLLKSTDGGATWRSVPTAAPYGQGPISCPAVDLCYLGKDGGQVILTTDGGATWTVAFDVALDPQSGFTTGQYNAVDCSSPTTCAAVGNNGLPAITTDGVRWRTSSTRSSANFVDVACPSLGICFILTDDGSVLLSGDNGITWLAEYPGDGVTHYGISCFSTTCVVVGDGEIATTANYGTGAWSIRRPRGSVTAIRSINCVDGQNCFAPAYDLQNTGGVEVSRDGGLTWQLQASGVAQIDAVDCASSGGNRCIGVGWPGAIVSYDGSFWSGVQRDPIWGTDETLLGITCANTANCYAVGTDGTILASVDGGQSWSSETSGTNFNLTAVQCSTATNCVAVGRGGTILVRANGTWQTRLSPTFNTLRAMSCTGSTCTAAGAGGTIIRSTDAGYTWSAMSSGTTAFLDSVECRSGPSFCIAAGDGGTLIWWDGTKWSPAPSPTIDTITGVTYWDINHVWIVGRGGMIMDNSEAFFEPCGAPLVRENPPSVGPAGGVIGIKAYTSDCHSPLFRFFIKPPGGAWNLVQDWSPSSTFAWDTPDVPGTYGLEVDVRDSGEPSGYDAYTITSYQLKPCSAAGLTAQPSSPTAPGSIVNLTATATCPGNPEYRFLVDGRVVQDYQLTNTYTWTTTGATLGTHRLEVDVRDEGATVGYETWAALSYTLSVPRCATPTLSASPAGRAQVGATVLLTASTSVCPTPNYRFLVGHNGTFTVAQNYGPGTGYVWNTSALSPGAYVLEVDVRNQGSTASYEAWAQISYTLVVCSAARLTTDKPSPQAPGTPVVLTASATCPTTPEYRFLVDGKVVQGYSTTSTFTWDSTGAVAGTHTLEVDVRDQASALGYEAWAIVTFKIA